MTRVLLLVAVQAVATGLFGQQVRFSVDFESQPIESVLDVVSENTGYYFSYNSALIDSTSRYTLKLQNVSLDEFLNRLLLGTGLEHQVLADQVIIRSKPINIAASDEKLFSISGRVLDSATQAPIAGANVFLSGTNIGSITDMAGYYIIDNVPIGSYEAIFTHLSYDVRTINVFQNKAGVKTLNAVLSQKTHVLDTLLVVSKRLIGPEERKKFLRIFTEEFIGRSSVARRCRIINPEILDFIYHKSEDKLEVFALEPVKIENWFLGYEITYIFEKFTKIGNELDFFGRARFKNMMAPDNRQRRIWLRNRRKIYSGSFLHFRRSLVEERLKKENFRMRIIPTDTLSNIPRTKAEGVKIENIITKTDRAYLLEFNGFLEVTFRRPVDEEYVRQFFEQTHTKHQQSLLKLKDGPVTIRANGGMEYPGVETYGYWYWERIADILPENYDPQKDEIE